ncbi:MULTISPECIES: RecQ family ATP-dependent DNA helicase [unclassified Oceanispirochaeta]|uniref:RecQ family ATP-dependent DNA helicase n=1 Tax=unclassified Oceanispirochaeta TaxID=2635722 RepID=UPI000E08F59E|nr:MULTISPECIES: RecQ family ATP-dependent DNA helicase [unclassified Oceanispirochaeta]MBF9018796.1 RecQ family ATP-dependent DNA helicase [Oceanispirochaeta sp. M2]NPD75265.1 RecQ family ATP-dependent DNA helicase [Oceanispirochaeta sp. M1]RDG28879.1 RecQ family ATP-dependent DNA helicase [Oceanispirochaeta sp. M1]
MKKYTANYTNTNHNFVLMFTGGERTQSKTLPAIYILKNILQRGTPTLMSSFLQKDIGSLHKSDTFSDGYPLISNDVPQWQRIIRGDQKNNYYPANEFFYEIIPEYLSDYKFIQQLILPEVSINEITQVNNYEFNNQQVDFYLPQAFLIIEIDGSQHKNEKLKDLERDTYTSKYGIETVRITTEDLQNKTAQFVQSMDQIKTRIETVMIKQDERKGEDKDAQQFTIRSYKEAFEKGYNVNNKYYLATAVIRFQILILELLEYDKLNLNQKMWNLEIREHDIENFEELAINDLFLWFKHILRLHKIPFDEPEVRIIRINENKHFSQSKDHTRIDFSLLKRYTDEFQSHENTAFVRTDYFDDYLYFKMTNSDKRLDFHSFKKYDYFTLSNTKPLKYKFNFTEEDSDEESLIYLLWNIFMQTSSINDISDFKFRAGQLAIIENTCSLTDTIGLLPTGGGKSVCYQLSVILQPAVSIIISPIKSLMYDQVYDLNECYFDRVNQITSDVDADERENIQESFSKGKYFFILVSPERFQQKGFRDYISLINTTSHWAYTVVDEAHCISEWGHDFRLSYLNLANTIRNRCNNAIFLGLTATASLNVLKDIRIEFEIEENNIITPHSYTRDELDFKIIDDKSNKWNSLTKLLESYQSEKKMIKNGLIFTRTVNGPTGCFSISDKLKNYLKIEVPYFSGSVPKVKKKKVMNNDEFNKYKRAVQLKYKKNQVPLIVATKAFGMGVNKKNIHFTVHYGLPSSLEALYQEGGRAGRDKEQFIHEKAHCTVLLSKPSQEPQKIWRKNMNLEKLKDMRDENENALGDLSTSLYLLTSNLEKIDSESKSIMELIDILKKQNPGAVTINGKSFKSISSQRESIERLIFRVCQLGIIDDWTITSYSGAGIFEVNYLLYDISTIKRNLLNLILKYENENFYETLLFNQPISKSELSDDYVIYHNIMNQQGIDEIEKVVRFLLQWIYNHFVYNRIQSLKTVYESCSEFTQNKIDADGFKKQMENYFKFTHNSTTLQAIANNPNEYALWFDVFYKIEDNKKISELINEEQIDELKSSISRFLESYSSNTGLNFISGLIRLMQNDFDDRDGKQRLDSSFRKIYSYSSETRICLLKNLISINSLFNNQNRDIYIGVLMENFFDIKSLKLMAEVLDDPKITIEVLKLENNRLKKIEESFYERFIKT